MAVAPPIEIREPHLLVVEGVEDQRFFTALIKHMQLQGIQIMPIGGKTNLRRNLIALSSTPGFSRVNSLAIVRDADEIPQAAFQSVHDALKAANLSAPKRPLKVAGSQPQVTIMILPRENKVGALEDICLESVEKDPAMSCVKEYFQCLHRQGVPQPKNMSKARVQVFLASKPKALRLGEAAEKGYWPWDAKALGPVIDFLQRFSS